MKEKQLLETLGDILQCYDEDPEDSVEVKALKYVIESYPKLTSFHIAATEFIGRYETMDICGESGGPGLRLKQCVVDLYDFYTKESK